MFNRHMKHTTDQTPSPLASRRVTVVGLGRFGGGVGAARWLAGQGSRVTVSDAAAAKQLAESVAQLEGLDIALHLGGHLDADFLDADLIVINPAIPDSHPLLARARRAGVPVTTEINLFIERCPCRVVGVTGSVGKSTTTAMIGEILNRRFTTHVGGNIGRSLLETLPDIRPDHVAVLELSSFQLERLPLVGISPHVALVTNLLPNHLDRHGTMDAYAAAKQNIYRFQGPDDVLILSGAGVSPVSEPLRGGAPAPPRSIRKNEVQQAPHRAITHGRDACDTFAA
jgi:UDP-N-acetylmuramoylalanine--D-glutamate ligase